MLQFQESVYNNRWVQRACLHSIRVINKIKKTVHDVDKIKEEFEKYKETEAYKKWLVEYEKRDEDDDIKNDTDPEGWDLFIKAAKDNF